MLRFRNVRHLVAAVAAAVFLVGSASTAEAGFTITLHEAGFGDQTINIASGTLTDTGNINFGDYRVNISAFDSAPGISTLFGGALVSQNTFTVTTITPAGADLRITVQDDTFSSGPYGTGNPVTLKHSMSTTALSDGTLTSHSFITGASTLTTTDISLTGPTLSGADNNSVSGSIAPLGSTFTMGNVSTVHFTGGSGTANYTVTTVAPVPAPAGMALVLTGLPVLSIRGWLRRRRQTA